MKVSRVLLIILLFIAFFEIGLFSSYTIINAEIPDPGELIDMQVNTISSIFSPDNVGGLLIKDPNSINVTNKYQLADELSEKAEVDGVNVDNMTVTTSEDTSEESFNVTITAFGYSKPKGNSGTIIINGEPDYKIIATCIVEYTVNGLEADLDTLSVDSILKVYDTDSSSSSSSSSYSGSSYGNSYSSSYGSSSYSSSSSYGSSSSGYSSGSSSSSSYSSDSSSGSSSSDYSSGGSSSGGSSSSDYNSGGSSSGGSSSGSSGDEVVLNIIAPIFS